jgi:RimJ/RimL family protein N-acetyltransferase
MVLDSIMTGNTAGQLWESEPEGDPLILWDKGNNVLYLAGDRCSPTDSAALADLVSHQIAPQSLAEGARYLKARALSGTLERALPAIFGELTLRPYPSRFLTYAAAAPAPSIAAPPLGITIAPIERSLLAAGDLANCAEVRSEIAWMWPSEEAFYDQGFGMLALLDRQVICWCTAEYVGPTHCGIGITTMPGYERRGIATATAAAFVGEAQRRGLTACWECGAANIGSRRVAEKVGFVDQGEEHYWAGSFAE